VRNHSFRTAPRATFYLPMSQESSDAAHVVIRASADPGSVAVAARDILRRSDPDVALGGLENFEHHLSNTVAADRFNSILLSLFAALALVLAVAGVYGVFSYVVTQQTREIGVRMALGARPGQMMRLILSRGAALAAAGAAIGLAGAWFLMTLLEQQLYGIQPRDPATFAVAAIVLVAVAVCACAIPARRAMRVDPLTALRSE
jgi:putative ABC transport system permease protein